jgi:hypothetical protein
MLENEIHFPVSIAPVEDRSRARQTIEIPDEIDPVVVSDGTLPGGWEQLADHPACKEAGDKWLRTGATLVLQVSAAPIPQESNYLLNPTHDEIRKVKVIHKRPFSFDPRLL